MKRIVTTTIMLMAVALGTIAIWRQCSDNGAHDNAVSSTGDLYNRYASQPGVRVGFIKDFRFDDTTLVDVTTIQALDSTGWHWMLAEFAVNTVSDSTGDVLQTYQLDDSHFVFLSYCDSSLCLVDAPTDRQYDAVLRYQLKRFVSSKQSFSRLGTVQTLRGLPSALGLSKTFSETL